MLSAAPVGRLVLEVFGVSTAERIRSRTRSAPGCRSSSTFKTSERTQGEDASICRPRTWSASGARRLTCWGPTRPRRCEGSSPWKSSRARALLAAGVPLAATLRFRPRAAVVGYAAGGMAALDSIERSGSTCSGATAVPASSDLRGEPSPASWRRARGEAGREHRARLRLLRGRHAPRSEELRVRHPAAPQARAPGDVGGLRAGTTHRRHRRRAGRPGGEAHRSPRRSQEHRRDRSADDDPVLVAVADAARRYRLPMSCFGEIIDGCEMDVIGTSYETIDELVVYCRKVAGSMGRLSLAVFGSRDLDRRSRSRTSWASRSSSRTSCAMSSRTPRSGACTCRAAMPSRSAAIRSSRAQRRTWHGSSHSNPVARGPVVRRGAAAASVARQPEPGLRRRHGRDLQASAGPDQG